MHHPPWRRGLLGHTGGLGRHSCVSYGGFPPRWKVERARLLEPPLVNPSPGPPVKRSGRTLVTPLRFEIGFSRILWLVADSRQWNEMKFVTTPFKSARRVACTRGCAEGPAMWGNCVPLALCRPDPLLPHPGLPQCGLPPPIPHPKVDSLQKDPRVSAEP